jgi:hypothetical protein
MKTNQNVQPDEVQSYELSNHKPYNEYNVPETPGTEVQYWSDDDELLDFTLMQCAHNHDRNKEIS